MAYLVCILDTNSNCNVEERFIVRYIICQNELKVNKIKEFFLYIAERGKNRISIETQTLS